MCYFYLNIEGNEKGLNRVKVNLMKFLYSLVKLNLNYFLDKIFWYLS